MSRTHPRRSSAKAPRLLLLPVVAALLWSGCGGGSVDCERVDGLYYLTGNSSGPCTDSTLTVDSTGQVSRSWNQLNEVGVIAGVTECPDARSESTTAGAEQASELLRTVCRQHNESYRGGGDCVGGWAYLTLRQGTTDLVETGNLACAEGMEETLETLRAFMDSL